MESLTLHSYPIDADNFRSCCIQIASLYSSCELEVIVYTKEENDDAEIIKNSPYSSLPILEVDEKDYIFDTVAAFLLVCDETLKCTSNPVHSALVQQFIQFTQTQILPSLTTLSFHLIRIVKITKSVYAKAREDLTKALDFLNNHLKNNTFLVGERISAADIFVASSLFLFYKYVSSPRNRLELKSLTRWFNTIVNQDSVTNVVGEFEYSTKAPDFSECIDDAVQIGKKEKQVKKNQQSNQKQKKEKSANKQEKNQENVDLEISNEKQNSPLDDLPKTNISADELRQKYFALPREEFIEFLFNNIEEGKWSFWRALYLDDHKLKEIYKSSNLINGMFSRIECIRKYSFGIVYLHGVENNSAIHALWLFKGEKNLFEVMDLDDIICYNFEKINYNEDREIIKNFLLEKDYKNLKINKCMMLR